MSTANPRDDQPPIKTAYPLPIRISCYLQLWIFKLSISILSTVGRTVLKRYLAIYNSTFDKSYPVRPHLTHRVFIPASYKAGEGTPLLPLYLDIHGGGFAIGTPWFDDPLCHTIANRFGILVVSLDYSKSPSVKFPVPTHDIAECVLAVLDDESLPIDKTRVAIGGFSAGGNLALSAAQLPELQGRLHGAVSWYPVVDWTLPTALKLANRPYAKLGKKDSLRRIGMLFDYGYIQVGQDLRDPLLSVANARREELPRWIFTVAAEYDMLVYEARQMMWRFADQDGEMSDEEHYAWEKGTYKWWCVKGVEHGFTHRQLERGEEEEKRQAVTDEVIGVVGDWLMKGPFAKEP